ncbi:19318_t:CDS:1, partial [Gigaspora margarita]
MSNTQYRESSEIISELSENDNNTENDISRLINDPETETSTASSALNQSFVKDFDRLNIEGDRINRYEDEVSTETVPRNDMTATNTSLST